MSSEFSRPTAILPIVPCLSRRMQCRQRLPSVSQEPWISDSPQPRAASTPATADPGQLTVAECPGEPRPGPGREPIQHPNTATPRAATGRARPPQLTDLLQRPPQTGLALICNQEVRG